MKTSNKLLIGLLSTIFFVIMAFFLDIRVFGEKWRERSAETKTENFPLEDFKHIEIEKLKSIKISPSEANRIQFATYNDTTEFGINYVIENDTLKISGKSSIKFRGSYTLFTKSNIESIAVKDSKIRLSGLDQDSIFLNIVDGEISSLARSDSDISIFKKARISGINSTIRFWDAKIEILELNIEKSRAEFRKDINHVNASIRSNSQLHLKNVEKLEIVKDKESRIYMR